MGQNRRPIGNNLGPMAADSPLHSKLSFDKGGRCLGCRLNRLARTVGGSQNLISRQTQGYGGRSSQSQRLNHVIPLVRIIRRLPHGQIGS